jgi:uncharacterized protein
MKVELGAAALLLCTAAGCKMDPFLYVPPRTDAYVFELGSDQPEEVVSADRVEQVRVEVDEEVSLGAVYVRGNVQPPRGHILYFHGAGTHLEKQFWRIKRMANLGYDVFAFDYRGFGTSTPLQPTEAGIERDSNAARQWLLDRMGHADRLVYYAHSFGTAAATQRAVLDPPAVLILESPLASVERIKSDATGMDFPLSFIARDTWDTAERVKSIHVPLLIAHGTEDELIRVEFGQEVFANANEPKEFILLEGGQHGDVLPAVQDSYAEFLERHLGGAGP